MPWFTNKDDNERNKELSERIKNAQTDEELDNIQDELDQYTNQNNKRLDQQHSQVSALDKIMRKR